jgi:hypothetical protein
MFRTIGLATILVLLTCTALSAQRHAPPSNPKTTDVKIISAPPVQPNEVKIIEAPAPPLETASEKEARLSHEANEQGLTAYTRILAWATGGLVAVAILQAALFFWQLVYMRKGLKDASISADAARDGALAANQSVTIAKQSLIAGEIELTFTTTLVRGFHM